MKPITWGRVVWQVKWAKTLCWGADQKNGTYHTDWVAVRTILRDGQNAHVVVLGPLYFIVGVST